MCVCVCVYECTGLRMKHNAYCVGYGLKSLEATVRLE